MVILRNQQADTMAASKGTQSQAQTQSTLKLNQEQVFRLIDSLLPFEACLYYQVLPLNLAANHLQLGMVNLEDTNAIDYIQQILSYMSYSFASKPITVEAHQAMLSAYLKHHEATKLRSEKLSCPSPDYRVESGATQSFGEKTSRVNQNERPTLILDQPTELNSLQQKLTDLSQDTLAIAQQLQGKLHQLQECANLNPHQRYGQLESLPVLNQLIENVNAQLQKLKQL